MSTEPDDTAAMRERRRRLAERKLVLEERRVEAQIRDEWWSMPRMMAAIVVFVGVLLVLGYWIGRHL